MCRAFSMTGVSPRYDEAALKLPPLFEWLKDTGKLTDAEMRRTFNCGIGGVLICAESEVDGCLTALKKADEHAFVIGDIQEK